jgi:L-ascorbate peroxidase
MFTFLLYTLALAGDLGSLEEAQKAADGLVFLLRAPGNCLEVIPVLPPNPPSKNMAALWIRGSFHDSGAFDIMNITHPGSDASVLSFLDLPMNAGLPESIATRFKRNINANISNSDLIALAGQVSVTHCGGPNFKFYPGRVDTTTPVSPEGRVPEGNETFDSIVSKLRRVGFTNEDIVALVTGSHSMGGIHKRISPDLTNNTFVPFDRTPGVFDNDVFQRTLNGRCPIPFDCEIAKHPTFRPIVERYARDQQAFFDQYAISFTKMVPFFINHSLI